MFENITTGDIALVLVLMVILRWWLLTPRRLGPDTNAPKTGGGDGCG